MPPSNSATSPRHPHGTEEISPARRDDISTVDTRPESPPLHEESKRRLPEPTSESTSAPADGGTGFLDLPPEIRNIIYEYAVVQDKPIRFTYDKGRAARQPYLARVNRQIRWECLPIFYGQNIFATPEIYTFLQALTPENRKSVQNLYVDWRWRRVENAEATLQNAIKCLKYESYEGITRRIKTSLRVGRSEKEVWVDLQELLQYEQVDRLTIEKRKETQYSNT